MSGLTTTGATVLHIEEGDYLDSYPRSIMLWRALTQWLGGMGVIVLSVAVLAKFTRGGVKLLAAESPGPTLTRLKPRITHTAKVMWLVYCMLSLLEFLILWACGMGPYHALYHTFTTMATGGFSSRVGSVGPGLGAVGPLRDYSTLSPWSKLILALLMWIGRLEVFTAIAIFNPELYETRRMTGLLKNR